MTKVDTKSPVSITMHFTPLLISPYKTIFWNCNHVTWGDITHKLRLRLFWQFHITELISWSFYTLYMSEPLPWTFTFKYEPHLTVLLGYPSYSHIPFLFCNGLKFGPCTHYNGIFPFSSIFLTRTASWLTLGLLIPL